MGELHQLMARLAGFGSPEVRVERNGTNIAGATSATSTLSSPAADNGDVSCSSDQLFRLGNIGGCGLYGHNQRASGGNDPATGGRCGPYRSRHYRLFRLGQ
jgi:hypothetical protein